MHTDRVELLGTQNDTYSMTGLQHRIGAKNCELTNLPISIGMDNVLSVVSDKIIQQDVPGHEMLADIRQSTDYSPFGVPLQNRSFEKTSTTCTEEVSDSLVEEPVQFTDFGMFVNLDGDLELDVRAPYFYTSNGASSVQQIENGESIEFEVANMPQLSNFYCIGLSYQETNYEIYTIDYGWYLYYTGQLYVWENGADNTASDDSIVPMGVQTVGDIYRIHRDNGTIRYYKNGTLVRSIADEDQTAPMLVDISINRLHTETNCKIQNLQAAKWNGGILVPERILYKGLSCAKVESDGDLYIDTTNLLSWRSGASGVQNVSENEYIEFEIENTPFFDNTYAVGLSYTNVTHDFWTADYTWYIDQNGNASIYEGASLSYSAGSYAVGDLFRITRSGGYIRYSKNGVVVFSTADPTPSTPLLIDLSLHRNPNNLYCAIHNLRVAKLQPGTPCQGSGAAVAGDYRYGFNGMEKDDEPKGSGNSYDFGARMHDPRLGRFLSIDAYAGKFAYQSPYSFAGNMPIWATDVNGDSVWVYSNTIDRAFGFGRHMFIRVKTGDRDVLIEMSGPAKGQKIGQVKVSDWTNGQITGRSNVMFHQVMEPIDEKNPDKFENDIIKYADYFQSKNIYIDADNDGKVDDVAINSLLPKYDKWGPNSNGFTRSLIEYAGGQLDFKPYYEDENFLPEFLPGAAWNQLEVYFKPLREKFGRDEYFKNTFGITVKQFNAMVDFAKTINAQRNNIMEKGNPNAPTDHTKTTITTPTVRYPAERPKIKSAENTENCLE